MIQRRRSLSGSFTRFGIKRRGPNTLFNFSILADQFLGDATVLRQNQKPHRVNISRPAGTKLRNCVGENDYQPYTRSIGFQV